MNMLRKVISVGALATILVLSCGARANADAIQLSCATCSSGSTTLISTGGSVTFSFIGQNGNGTDNGTAFIGVLVPSGGTVPTLSLGMATLVAEESVTFSGGPPPPTLGATLGESFSDFNLSAFNSASQQVGINPSSYTVYEYNLGSASLGSGTGNLSPITVGGLATGTVIVGWLEIPNATTPTATLQTPFSESITASPEPGTLMLFGSALLGLGVFLRRRAIPCSQV